MPCGKFLHVDIFLITKQIAIVDARWNNLLDVFIKFICHRVPVRIFHKWAKQPGSVDLRSASTPNTPIS